MAKFKQSHDKNEPPITNSKAQQKRQRFFDLAEKIENSLINPFLNLPVSQLTKLLEEGKEASTEMKIIEAIVEKAWKGEYSKETVDTLTKLLDNEEDIKIKSQVLMALGWMAYHREDISSVLPKLKEFLNRPEKELKEGVTFLLANIARHGADIAETIPMLKEFLNNDNDEIKLHAARAILYFAKYTSNIDPLVVEKAKNVIVNTYSGDEKVQRILEIEVIRNMWTDTPPEEIGRALSFAASTVDMNHIIKALGEALDDEDENVKMKAVETLGNAAKHGMDIGFAVPKMIKLAKEKNADVRKAAIYALAMAGGLGIDISKATLPMVKALFDEEIEAYAYAGLLAIKGRSSFGKRMVISVVLDFRNFVKNLKKVIFHISS